MQSEREREREREREQRERGKRKKVKVKKVDRRPSCKCLRLFYISPWSFPFAIIPYISVNLVYIFLNDINSTINLHPPAGILQNVDANDISTYLYSIGISGLQSTSCRKGQIIQLYSTLLDKTINSLKNGS